MIERRRANATSNRPARPMRICARRVATFVALLLMPFAALGTPEAKQDIDPLVVAALSRAMSAEAEHGDHFDAEVWLLATVAKLGRYVADSAEREAILRCVYREANRHDLDPDLVLALMQVESRFDRFAVSSAGAQGLMQVMPFWRNEIGRPHDNLTQIDTNVRYGTAILAQYLNEARGDLIDALARYNGSRGRLNYPELVVYAYRARWQTQTTDELPKLRAGCSAYGLRACGTITRGR